MGTPDIDAINRHNQKASTDKCVTYTMGVNQFTHLRYDEFIAQHTGYVRNKNSNSRGGNVQVTRPSRAKRALTTTASGCTCTCASSSPFTATTAKPTTTMTKPTTTTTTTKPTTISTSSASVDWRGTPLAGPIKI